MCNNNSTLISGLKLSGGLRTPGNQMRGSKKIRIYLVFRLVLDLESSLHMSVSTPPTVCSACFVTAAGLVKHSLVVKRVRIDPCQTPTAMA